MNYNRIGQLGQWLSLALTSVGLYLMLTHKTPIGDDYATTGALVLAIATKIRYYGGNLVNLLRQVTHNRRIMRKSRSSFKRVIWSKGSRIKLQE